MGEVIGHFEELDQAVIHAVADMAEEGGVVEAHQRDCAWDEVGIPCTCTPDLVFVPPIIKV